MALLDSVREFLSGRDAAAQSDSRAAPPPPEDVGDGQAPFDGYESLDGREVMDELSKHSQTELDRVEDYERAHKDRKSVLDKLRYLRGHEPLKGYDDLTAEEVLTAVTESDRAVLKRIRGYERKFANRPKILDAVGHALHERQSSEPTKPAPGYQAMSSDKT